MGPLIGAQLGNIGSELIFPYTHRYAFDDYVKELRLCGYPAYVYLVQHMDFNDPNMLDWVMKDSNVVINLCGPRNRVKDYEEAREANYLTAVNVAKACARNKNILRYIQFSAAGVDEHSPSVDLKTKW